MIPNPYDVRFTHHLEVLKDGEEFVLPAGGRISDVTADVETGSLHVWWIEETPLNEDGEIMTEEDLVEYVGQSAQQSVEQLDTEFGDALEDAWGN